MEVIVRDRGEFVWLSGLLISNGDHLARVFVLLMPVHQSVKHPASDVLSADGVANGRGCSRPDLFAHSDLVGSKVGAIGQQARPHHDKVFDRAVLGWLGHLGLEEGFHLQLVFVRHGEQPVVKGDHKDGYIASAGTDAGGAEGG